MSAPFALPNLEGDEARTVEAVTLIAGGFFAILKGLSMIRAMKKRAAEAKEAATHQPTTQH
jgi:hypothetical protein